MKHVEKNKNPLSLPTSFSYTIEGTPVPLARARHGMGRTYDSQKKLKFSCGLQLQSQHNGLPLILGPLKLEVVFFLHIPSGLRLDLIQGIYGTPHDTRPDLSNLIKYIEDVATGIIYKDDSQISIIIANKIFSAIPRTEFTITRLDVE